MLWGCQGLTKKTRRQTSPVAPSRSAALLGQSPLAAEVHSGFLSQFVAGLAENNP
jgi:hypothetical protein